MGSLFTVDNFLNALCLLCMIEGAAYGLFPNRMKKLMAMVGPMPVRDLRATGFFILLFGVAIAWARHGAS